MKQDSSPFHLSSRSRCAETHFRHVVRRDIIINIVSVPYAVSIILNFVPRCSFYDDRSVSHTVYFLTCGCS